MMKLITKITINYFALTLVVFILGGIAAYVFIHREVEEKIDWKLKAEKKYILQHATQISDISVQNMNLSSYLEIGQLNDQQNFVEELKDTLVHNPIRGQIEPFKQLRFRHTIQGQTYQIILRKNMVESQDLKDGLTDSMWIVFGVLLLILIFSNYFMSRKIWSSFYQTLHQINRYDLTKNEILTLPSANIKELAELNRAISKMSAKIRDDYLNLKEFSENASHEIQTPLAIIKSKTELLFQWEGLTAEQSTQIQAIDQAATKLSRLNQSLLLLTKIENRQFEYDEEIDLKSLIEAQLRELDEFIQLRQITVHAQMEQSKIMRLNPVLADVLLRNLLTNAIRYCNKPGTIQIHLDPSQLIIANTGAPLKIQDSQIFERFKKGQQSSDSLGLGLSIVKKICDLYGFQIQYTYQNNYHTFKISL